ncbi:hypothetical protein GCM10010387_02420 [Streptomyces inusitatus]|uniref:DUF11 domain-containing protein n=1 Tax=Streptomyces inusitatus TaxID=68221 RepID=A0A918UJ30_9ACTN|nr:DUF11 domain-containing protein [Streptomyces inusitatus]GGZ13879.1 hypothetical protein GCM10010387_02420 [Streptomyces inusitatus]
MRSVHGRSATAARRAGGVIAACCVLAAGALISAPGASASATPGADAPAAASPASASPSADGSPSSHPTPALRPVQLPVQTPARTPAGTTPGPTPDSKAAPGERADLALHTEVGPAATAQAASPEAAPGAAAPAPVTRPVEPPAATAGAARAERPVNADGVFDYRITALNHGPSQAVNVVITDELPPQLTFVSSPDGCTAQGRTITCGPLASLAVGATHTWLITVALVDDYTGDGSDITNIVAVDSQTADPYPANNTASTTGIHVPPGAGKADLSLRKTALLPDGRNSVTPGETFTYRLTVHNKGPATARNVQVTDPLPEELRFVSSPGGCAPSGGFGRTVSCPPLDRLPAGESVTYEIVVRVRENAPRYGGGDGGHGGGHRTEIDNIASVTSTTADPVPGNNRNASGTTAPDGGPLYLKHGSRPTHPPRPTDPTGPGHPHPGGRPQLPSTGRELPRWLPWSAGLTLAAGGALVVLARRSTRR